MKNSLVNQGSSNFLRLILLVIFILILLIPHREMNWILRGFQEKLVKCCEIEEVPIIYHDGYVALNLALWGKEEVEKTPWGNLAVGCYRHSKDGTFKEIHLSGLNDVWTLAHEFGHHLAIKKAGDKSEKAAEVCVSLLARQFIPWWQRMLIPIEISVYAPKSRLKVK